MLLRANRNPVSINYMQLFHSMPIAFLVQLGQTQTNTAKPADNPAGKKSWIHASRLFCPPDDSAITAFLKDKIKAPGLYLYPGRKGHVENGAIT